MRKRLVYANREILASDVNSISDYLIYNEQKIIQDLLGVVAGVASGLTPSYSLNQYTISSGSYCDGTKFYELLANVGETLSTAGTYKIYITLGSTNDIPINGYRLLNTITRTESYDIANVRTYDSITVASTTGSLPVGAIQIAQAVSDGINITSLTDMRTFVTFGTLISNSLQYLTEHGISTASRTGKISGQIINDTDSAHNIWTDVTINNSHAGYGHKVTTGTNSGAIGYLANINNNIGFKSISTGTNAIGFNSLAGANDKSFSGTASSQTGSIGLNLDGYGKGINVSNSLIGGLITGNNTDVNEIGLKLLDNSLGLHVENTNLQGNQFGSLFKGSSITGVLNNSIVSIEAIGSLVGQNIGWSDSANSDSFIGTFYKNSNTNNANASNSIAMFVDADLFLFKTGIFLKDTENFGLSITKSNSTFNQIPIYISNTKTNGSALANKSILLEQNTNSVGIHINKIDATTTNSIGMIIGDYTTSNKFLEGIRLRNNLTGIDIGVNANETGINIAGANSDDYGIKIDNFKYGINITNSNSNSGALLNLSGQNTTSGSSDGITASNVATGLKIVGSNVGSYFDNAVNYAIKIFHTNGGQIYMQPYSSLPALVDEGHIAIVNTGSGTQLKVYTNTGWKTATLT